MMNTYDWRTPFDRNCRVPGTRINRIMSMIERGMSDEEIANRLVMEAAQDKRLKQNGDCDAFTISVYRKAYNGTLTEPNDYLGGRPAEWMNIDAAK